MIVSDFHGGSVGAGVGQGISFTDGIGAGPTGDVTFTNTVFRCSQIDFHCSAVGGCTSVSSTKPCIQ